MSVLGEKMAELSRWEELGAGSYGKVLSVRVTTGQQTAVLAVKWMLIGEDETTTKEALAEYTIASMLAKRQVPSFPLGYAGFLAQGDALPAGHLKSTSLYFALVTELAEEASLQTLINRGTVLDHMAAGAIFFDLLWSLFIAHSQAALLYHGDLSASNIVFKKRPRGAVTSFLLFGEYNSSSHVMGTWAHRCTEYPLIVDLGLCSFIRPQGPVVEGADHDFLALHRPPELYFGREHERASPSDVWQLAILALTLFTRLPESVTQARQARFRFMAKPPTPNEMAILRFLDNTVADAIDFPLFYTRACGHDRAVGPDFVALLRTLPLDRAVHHFLTAEKENSNMYMRFISIMLLQEAIGNGWRPTRAVAAGFSGNVFFEALYSDAVVAFVNERVLPPNAPLMQTMRSLLFTLPPEVRALMKHMLAWDPQQRPTCQQCLLHPLFRDAFGTASPPVASPHTYTYTAHARPPITRATFTQASRAHLSAVQGRLIDVHANFLSAEQERLRKKVENRPILHTQEELVSMLANSLSLPY
jgi:serine/threonine protein kinase